MSDGGGKVAYVGEKTFLKLKHGIAVSFPLREGLLCCLSTVLCQWFYFSNSYLLCSHHLISLSRDAKTIASHLISPFSWRWSIHRFSCSFILQQVSFSSTLDLAISPSASPSRSTHHFASFLFLSLFVPISPRADKFLCWCEIGTKCFEGFEQHSLEPQMTVSSTVNVHHNH